MRRLAPILALAFPVLAGCTQPRSPEARATEFCAAAYAGDTRRASEAASELTAKINAPTRTPAVAPMVAAWMRSLPCVESVTISDEIVETEPGVQEITFVLRARPGDSRRRCNADLHLVEPFAIGVHPSTFVSSNPDHRCSPM